jgi:hypothetical protein
VADLPVYLLYLPRVAHMTSGLTCLVGLAARLAAVSFQSVAVWPAQNRAIYVAVEVQNAITARNVFWINGATVNGHVDVGIYQADGSLLASCGSTAMSGASAIQSASITATDLNPGRYWIAMASDSATATFRAAPAPKLLLEVCGVQEQATAFALPSTAIFANPSSDYVPLCGFTSRTVI